MSWEKAIAVTFLLMLLGQAVEVTVRPAAIRIH